MQFIGEGLDPKCIECGNYILPCTVKRDGFHDVVCKGCDNHDHGKVVK